MTRILLLSDTHSYIDDIILKHVKQADEVWHAGDIGAISVTDAIKELKPLRAVYGNIDSTEVRNEFPEHQKFICEGLTIWMTHIGGYPPNYNGRVRKVITTNPPDIFICGHSHILKVMPHKALGLIHMNPGAIGKHGFHNARTMLRFNIDNKQLKNLEVIEYKR